MTIRTGTPVRINAPISRHHGSFGTIESQDIGIRTRTTIYSVRIRGLSYTLPFFPGELETVSPSLIGLMTPSGKE